MFGWILRKIKKAKSRRMKSAEASSQDEIPLQRGKVVRGSPPKKRFRVVRGPPPKKRFRVVRGPPPKKRFRVVRGPPPKKRFRVVRGPPPKKRFRVVRGPPPKKRFRVGSPPPPKKKQFWRRLSLHNIKTDNLLQFLTTIIKAWSDCHNFCSN
jgi:hypothetical protein